MDRCHLAAVLIFIKAGEKNEKTLKNQRFHRIFLLIFVDFFKKMLIIVIRMDIISEKPMTLPELQKAIAGGKPVVGAKQLRKALNSGTVRHVFLATDADPAVTEPIAAMCRLHSAEISWVRSMAELGRACGIDVGAAAAAVVNNP